MKDAALEKAYQPEKVEEKIYGEWMEKNLFSASSDSSKAPYCIVIPPPNITGSLHMGHALDNTIQDILIRWKRMEGYESLWVPGEDHAGIATQTVVEKGLAAEGLTRHSLGREKFLERVWEWARLHRQVIPHQLRRMGCSCDWSRERFTLDEGCYRAVREAFVRLYEKKLIYRGRYITNWCPRCLTALSDLEVEHSEEEGKLYHVRYPFARGKGAITIATTRPETIFADTAIAVHPGDKRFRDKIGRHVVIPVLGKRIPIIEDEAVDPSFGTGALKITPAHDPNDFEIGLRHELPAIPVIDENGIMDFEELLTDQASFGGRDKMVQARRECRPFQGLDREECRRKFVQVLKDGGFLVKEEDYLHAVGTCYRCRTAIEPSLSPQWFVRMKELAGPAIEAVRDGRVRFVPEKYNAIYLKWMENIRDWCISRQLWWGHRIPVWTCDRCSSQVALREDPPPGTLCDKCGGELQQDPDVLDTWFSSGLWPFSTLGWPDATPDLEFFYPTSVLVTARDIIFLWVARMIMMGLEFMGDIPFKDVCIHATILAADGRRMSKSLGTGVDPLELFDRYGSDATRFGLIYMTAQGQDIRYTEERIQMSRNFANKIWNACRFCLKNMETMESPSDGLDGSKNLNLADRWILSRLNSLISLVRKSFDSYEFADAARALYEFFWGDFCDWYIELVKPVFQNHSRIHDKARVQAILLHVLENFLKLLHPMMPFITEELWRYLPGERGELIRAPWPRVDEKLVDPSSESRMNRLIEVIRGIRNIRSELGIPPQKTCEVLIEAGSELSFNTLNEGKSWIEDLSKAAPLSIHRILEERPSQAISFRTEDVELFIPLKGVVDVEQEIQRLEKEIAANARLLAGIQNKLQNRDFVSKAPPEVVEKERNRVAELLAVKEKIDLRLNLLLEDRVAR
jgi:valyl-tRNA synthetase